MTLNGSHAYTVVDVFTTEPLAGNSLAVFPDASEFDAVTMQRIARELNLAETAFVLLATRKDCAARVRIFTPAKELAFAGHPTRRYRICAGGKGHGNHQIPGIGVGFVPEVLNRSILDEVVAVTDEHAFSCARRLARRRNYRRRFIRSGSPRGSCHSRTARRRREDHRGDSSRHGRKVYHHELVFRRSGAASMMNSPGRLRRN
jgi:Phenazine biosynthesis-like protein